jgi:hypothetical protein
MPATPLLLTHPLPPWTLPDLPLVVPLFKNHQPEGSSAFHPSAEELPTAASQSANPGPFYDQVSTDISIHSNLFLKFLLGNWFHCPIP